MHWKTDFLATHVSKHVAPNNRRQRHATFACCRLHVTGLPGPHLFSRPWNPQWDFDFRSFALTCSGKAILHEQPNQQLAQKVEVHAGSGFCCLAEVQHVEGRVAYAVHPIASCRVFLNLGRFVPRRTLELLSSSVARCRKPKLCRLSLYACVSSESRSWRHAKAFSCPADSQCPRAPKAHGASWLRSLLPRTRSQRPALEYRASPKAPALVRLYIHLWPAPRGNPAASVWG